MQLQQGDIVVRKTQREGETLWLSERLVLEVGGISDGALRKNRVVYKSSVQDCYKNNNILPNTGKGWRWAKFNGAYYYAYDNIPDRKPTFYRSKFGTKEALKAQLNEVLTLNKAQYNAVLKNSFFEVVKQRIDAEDIRYYMYQSAVLFAPHRAKQLAEARAWCDFVREYSEGENYKKLGVHTKQNFYTLCAEILAERKLEGLKVNNAHYLRNKVDKYPMGGTLEARDFLVSDKYDNDNARKVGRFPIIDEDTGEVFRLDIHQALMYSAYMNPFGSSKEALRQLYVGFYTNAIQDFGYEPIAYRTFCHHLTRFNRRVKAARQRHGEDYWRKSYLTYVPSKKLQYAHSLFAGDGSGTINYKYTDQKGKERTMKLYVMLISDVMSRKIVGWSVAPKGQHSEDYEMLEKALKMAIEKCEYQTMFEFISDNHGAFTSTESKELLTMVFNKVRTIAPGNSQANPAETEFRLFKHSLKGLSNFGTSSWNVSVEGQSNPDYFDIDALPSYEDAVLQFYDVVEQWNSAKLRDGVSPNERFENKHPKCTEIDGRIIRRIYGNHTAVDVSYMRGFVQVSKTRGYEHRDTFLFEIPDYWDTGVEEISKALGYKKNAKVRVVWTGEMADLYTMDYKFIMSCPPTTMSSQAYIEADEMSDKALGHHLKTKKKAVDVLDDFEQMVNDAMDALPYAHQMAVGGNKESYNETMNIKEEQRILSKKERINRDFKQNW